MIYVLGICCIYTFSRFNSYFIKLVTLRLYNYNFLEKTIIRRVEKHFIKYLNAAVLDTISIPMRICSVYIQHIIGFSLNQLTTFKSIAVVYTKKWKLIKSLSKVQRSKSYLYILSIYL